MLHHGLWLDRITNMDDLNQTNNTSIEAVLLLSQLCWSRHVIHMNDNYTPKQLFFGELEHGKKLRTPMDTLQSNLKENHRGCTIKPADLQNIARDRIKWCAITGLASSSLEKEQRHQQKQGNANIEFDGRLQCTICHRFATPDSVSPSIKNS